MPRDIDRTLRNIGRNTPGTDSARAVRAKGGAYA